jgi:hypothetical protein
MFERLIDTTLPAHDPNFPKPRGLLPVPPEIEETVAREEARALREHGVVITEEARRRMRDECTLNWYYDGSYVASRRTPDGVEVLAVGWDEVEEYRNAHPAETRKDVRIGMA